MNADKISCKVLTGRNAAEYKAEINEFRGCPTVAITKGGKMFAAWYEGGEWEPDMNNFNLVKVSRDLGKTWSKPFVVIPSDKEKQIHALDVQLWVDPENKLHIFWVQNNVELCDKNIKSRGVKDGFVFNDSEHAEWEMVCANPDEDKLVFSKPRFLFHGFLRCKPLVLKNGDWLYCGYDQLCDKYSFEVSKDKGKTFEKCYGGKKIRTPFDESMMFQRDDESIVLYARPCKEVGEIVESVSTDGGKTWTDGWCTRIDNPNTRFFVAKLPSGNVLLINNDHRCERRNMSVYLSEDDGKTYKFKHIVDERIHTSYPDADLYDGRIYMLYDRERFDPEAAREILLVSFTEEDIKKENCKFDIEVIARR